ncbi:phosphatase 2C-like domain-containing protein [Mucidula mucida]|nr:phosphatase 2C-like domain-containing protein [Mucidula mucida]
MASPPVEQLPLVDKHGNLYTIEPEYSDPTYVDSDGVRYFLQLAHQFRDIFGKQLPFGRYTLVDSQVLENAFRADSHSSEVYSHDTRITSATFQAFKLKNEDRSFVHSFEQGTLFGILDGHGGHQLSDYAAQKLPLLLEASITAALASSGETHAAVQHAFEKTFLEFDTAIGEDFMALFAAKSSSDWTQREVIDLIKADPENDNKARRAVSGTTAIIGFLTKDKEDLWVACLGDSEALSGRLCDGSWTVNVLSEHHNTKNLEEIARIQAEHPGENVLKYGRLLGMLMITRAFGDFELKVAPDYVSNILIPAVLPTPIPPPFVAEWAENNTTGPYLSAKPSVTRFSLQRGDIIVFASDGLGDSPILASFSAVEKRQLFVDLAAGRDEMDEWHRRVGHQFIKASFGDNNAERVIKNVVFGTDEVRAAKELVLEVPESNHIQDDITVVVVEV